MSKLFSCAFFVYFRYYVAQSLLRARKPVYVAVRQFTCPYTSLVTCVLDITWF